MDAKRDPVEFALSELLDVSIAFAAESFVHQVVAQSLVGAGLWILECGMTAAQGPEREEQTDAKEGG